MCDCDSEGKEPKMSASKTDKMSSSGGKPVPMKLFAAWEVDRTPPNCIPRYETNK